MDHSNPDASTPSTAPRRRRWLRKAGVALLASLVSLLAGEGLCRLLPDPWIRPDLTPLLEADPLLGWRHRPESRSTVRGADFEALVRYDAEGHRPVAENPDPATSPRLCLLGDSFLDGYSVPEEQHLATRLRDRLRTFAPGVTIHNLGTVGYSTDQELLQYERWSQEHEADVVLLFFHDNDVAGNGLQSAQLGPKPWFRNEQGSWTAVMPRSVPASAAMPAQTGLRPWLREHSAGYRQVMHFVRSRPGLQGVAVRRGWMQPQGHPLIATHGLLLPAEYLLYLRAPPAQLEDWWSATEATLLRLEEHCRQQGSRLILVRVPIRAELEPRLWEDLCAAHALDPAQASPDLGRERLEQLCARRDLVLLDAREALDPDVGESAWLPVDGHWTAAGHDRVAEWLAEQLRPYLRAGGAD